MKPKIKKLSEEELKKEARDSSIREGIFNHGKISFGDHYLAPFAIALNASSSLVAMLSSVAGLLGPISQTFGSRLLKKYSRKKIILASMFLESLVWLPLILIAILFHFEIIVNILPLLFMICFGYFIIMAHLELPAWFSWMGDIVEEKYRGKFFSKRTLILGFISTILAIGASFFLDYFKSINMTMYGFVILFSLAFISRILAFKSFRKIYDPKFKLKKENYFSFSEFLINAPKNNFGKFALFRATFGFATSISTPLIAVYLLRNLNFAYSTYMIIILAGTFYSLLVLELLGKFSDQYGSYNMLAITTIFLPIVPILWILSPSPYYLLFVPVLVSGISWAGFHLAVRNFIYENVGQQKRGMAVSYFNLLNGIGIFLGAGVGAILIKFLDVSFIEPILLIFIIGGIARMFAVFFWIPKIKDIKYPKKFNAKKAFKEIILKDSVSTLSEEVREIASIGKYFRG